MPELPIFNLHPKDFQGSAAPSTAAATSIMYSLLLHLLAADLLFTQGPIQESLSKECRISVRGETLYLTMLSAVTPTQ